LNFIVPLERQSLFKCLWSDTKINDQFIFPNLAPELENTTWERYGFLQQWLLLINKDEEKLIDVHLRSN